MSDLTIFYLTGAVILMIIALIATIVRWCMLNDAGEHYRIVRDSEGRPIGVVDIRTYSPPKRDLDGKPVGRRRWTRRG